MLRHFGKRCIFIAMGRGILGALYTVLPTRLKDAACKTFPNVSKSHRPDVKAPIAENESQFSGALQAIFLALKCLNTASV